MATPIIITEPAVEPLSVDEVKTFFSITDSLNDVAIATFIKSARLQAESHTARSFITQTVELALDEFPNEIELPLFPVQSITSVKYIDTDETEQTLDSSTYTLDQYSPRRWLLPTYNNYWPTTSTSANAVKIRYVTGWGDAGTDVPEDIKLAMLIAIGQWIHNLPSVENPTASLSKMPFQFYDLLNRHASIVF
ncbi:MAG: hypothetical protein JAY90_18525 [Candidatus Thiodiazotropha lotti]|nr:hypothetical protein [Candidatus Thiodiazotropha lotti]